MAEDEHDYKVGPGLCENLEKFYMLPLMRLLTGSPGCARNAAAHQIPWWVTAASFLDERYPEPECPAHEMAADLEPGKNNAQLVAFE